MSEFNYRVTDERYLRKLSSTQFNVNIPSLTTQQTIWLEVSKLSFRFEKLILLEFQV